MDVVYPCCCGLDIHHTSVVACRLTRDADAKPVKELRTFGTMTADLLALGDWLAEAGCTHVAMESTGIYWKPVYNLLEDRFALVVVNAQHIKAVPGRKTDVRDAEWIADLLQHGLLRASFIPPTAQRELRELTRYRTSLVQERAAEINRIQKVLEGANIKLGAVASSVVGVSGKAMLHAIVGGATDATALADLAKGRLREKRSELERALQGRVGPHQRFVLGEQLCHLDGLDESIERISAEIARRVAEHDAAIARLQTIPGVGRRTAEALVAEIGTEMSRFPSARHLASWAGICPGNNESAGKRRSGATRKGSPWLRAALTEAAWGASHTKQTYLGAQYRRLAPKRGRKRAIVAVAHSILVSAYYLLTRQEDYVDLGPNYFDERDRRAVEKRLVERLERLGLKVTVERPEEAA